eukprot:11163107-Lingulodinium_polyedra.AAC.1
MMRWPLAEGTCYEQQRLGPPSVMCLQRRFPIVSGEFGHLRSTGADEGCGVSRYHEGRLSQLSVQ